MKVDASRCLYCGGCVGVCPVDAIRLYETKLVIDEGKCIKCGRCAIFCPVAALSQKEAKTDG